MCIRDRLRAQKLITRGPVSHEDIRASMRIRRTARKAIADYVTGLSVIRARAGDRSEISHLQNGDRAEMPRKKQSPPPPTLIPVSYTHLDVYKRQICNWGFLKDQQRSTPRKMQPAGFRVVRVCTKTVTHLNPEPGGLAADSTAIQLQYAAV